VNRKARPSRTQRAAEPAACLVRPESGSSLTAHKFYVLTPPLAEAAESKQSQVLGPFDDHRAAWLARCAWAYDVQSEPLRAEILRGEQLASDYGGRYGSLPTGRT